MSLPVPTLALPDGWPWSYGTLVGTSGLKLTWDTVVASREASGASRPRLMLHPQQLADLPARLQRRLARDVGVELVVDERVPFINGGADWMGACVGSRAVAICSRREAR